MAMTEMVRFKKINQKSSARLIIEELLGAIQSDNFQIGDRLPSERDLANDLGVSRPTLREAIAALAILGILEIRQGSGTYIRLKSIGDNLSLQAIALLKSDGSPLQALEMLTIIEPHLAALAAERAEDADLQRMKRALNEIKERSNSQMVFGGAGLRFHTAIIRSIGNPIIEHSCSIALGIYYGDPPEWWDVQKEKLTKPGQLASIYNDMEKIYLAIEAGDPEQARACMETYLANIHRGLVGG
jgi:DNA-binding FadR family transcriptional regulator